MPLHEKRLKDCPRQPLVSMVKRSRKTKARGTAKDAQQDTKIAKISRMLKPELKIINDSVSAIGFTGAGQIYPLLLPAEGDTGANRTGVRIRVMRVMIYATMSTNQTNAPFQCVRYGVGVDKAHNNTANSWDSSANQVTGVFDGATLGAHLGSTQRGRYRILADHLRTMMNGNTENLTAAVAGTVGSGSRVFKFDRSFKSGIVVRFGGSSGATTNVMENSIFFYGFADTGQVNVVYQSHIWFTDV